MKTIPRIALGVTLVVCAQQACVASMLNVDINGTQDASDPAPSTRYHSGTGAVGQVGDVWNQVDYSAGSVVADNPAVFTLVDGTTPSTLTLSISTNLWVTDDYTNGAFGTNYLMRDYIAQKDTEGTVTVTIGGVIPNAAYDLYLYSDNDGGGVGGKFYIPGYPGGTNTSAGGATDVYTLDVNYVLFDDVVSDAQGRLVISMSGEEWSAGQGTYVSVLNGFQLVGDIPVASTLNVDINGTQDASDPAPSTRYHSGAGAVGQVGDVWNQVDYSAGSVVADNPAVFTLVDGTTPSTLTLSISSNLWFTDDYTNGAFGTNYLMRDYIAQKDTEGSVTVTIGGVIPNAAYDLYLYSNNDGADVGGKFYIPGYPGGTNTSAGGATDVFTVDVNYVFFNDVVSDAQGRFVISMSGEEWSAGQGTYVSVLNGFQLRGDIPSGVTGTLVIIR